MSHFLLVPQIKIHNANAMSSPYTIGFPAMTAWLGAMHALERKMRAIPLFENLRFLGLAVSSHAFELQIYRGERDFVASIKGTANPLDKDGSRPAIIEEARCHVTVSLLMQFEGVHPDEKELFLAEIPKQLLAMKIASGDVQRLKECKTLHYDEDEEGSLQKLMQSLMLGYVLKERRDLMQDSMNEGKDALDALLEHLKIEHRADQDENGKVTWRSTKKTKGWIVPIAVGFQGISELGIATNQRDPETPHRFAEAMLTLGEFVMPYRIKDLNEILWHYRVEPENNLYLCQTFSSL